MNAVTWILKSGTIGVLIGSSAVALALNKTELEAEMTTRANAAGVSVTAAQSKAVLNAWAAVLKEETAAGRAVHVDGVGTWHATRATGTMTPRSPRTGAALAPLPTYSIDRKATVTKGDQFASLVAARSGASLDEARALIAARTAAQQRALRVGDVVTVRGEGSYYVGKRTAQQHYTQGHYVHLRAHKVPKARLQDSLGHTKFKADDAALSNVN